MVEPSLRDIYNRISSKHPTWSEKQCFYKAKNIYFNPLSVANRSRQKIAAYVSPHATRARVEELPFLQRVVFKLSYDIES